MATIYHEAEEQFQIENQSNNLTIEVETGNGQGGGVIVFFENTLLQEKNTKYVIENKTKVNRWVTVAVVIKDKLTQTNWTNVAITIKEDNLQSRIYKYSREVPNHLDTIVYTIKIKILKDS